MNETQVTVVGNVVTAISKRRLDDGTVVANFRVGNNERRYDRSTDRWVPGERLYVQVQCWRRLAENAAASLALGDPVVVTGRLFTRNYEHDGQRRSVVTLDAHTVAADLSRCTASIVRSRSEWAAAPPAADAVVERSLDGDAGRVPPVASTAGAAPEQGERDSRLVGVAPVGEG
jgi:single-strand DNA-binding protein